MANRSFIWKFPISFFFAFFMLQANPRFFVTYQVLDLALAEDNANQTLKVSCEDYGKPFSKSEWKSDNAKCGPWKKVKDGDCVYKGQPAATWERNCASASPCAAEFVCLNVSPVGMKEACLDWWKNEGAECLSDKGQWEQHWARTCTDMRLLSDMCSNAGPRR